MKKHLGTAGKGFHVGSVLGQQRDNLGGEAILAADVGEGTNHGIVGLKVKEAFDLAVQAKRQRVPDQRSSKAAVDAGPDCGNDLAHLLSETRVWMSERCQHVQLGYLPDANALLNQDVRNDFHQIAPENLGLARYGFEGRRAQWVLFQDATDKGGGAAEGLVAVGGKLAYLGRRCQMLVLQDRDGYRPAFNPDRGQAPDGGPVAGSAIQPFQLQMKAAAGIKMGTGSFGAAVSHQELILRVMVQEFGIVAGRGCVIKLLGQSQSEIFALIARLKLAVSGRGGTPGYLIKNVCHGFWY
ncbi:MAG: hypothetical protein ABSH49_11370 [Bryobacteraceae bacterium]